MRNKTRHKRSWELRKQGYTYREIGEIIGSHEDPSVPITVDRARQLCLAGERIEKYKESAPYITDLEKLILNNVGVRCVKVLKNYGYDFESSSVIERDLRSGKIGPGKMHNLGWKTIKQLALFLGVDLKETSLTKSMRESK